MIEGNKFETFSDLKEQGLEAKNSVDQKAIEEVEKKVEARAERPTNNEILESYNVGTLNERLAIDRSIAEQGIGGKVAVLAKYDQIEANDKRIKWDKESKVPELKWKHIQKDTRNAVERLFKRPPKMEDTDEVAVYVNLHNGKDSKDNTVLIMTTKFDKGGILNMDKIMNNSGTLFQLTDQSTLATLYGKPNQEIDELKKIDALYFNGSTVEDHLKRFHKEHHKDMDQYWIDNDKKTNEKREKDPREWERKVKEEELHNRIDNLGERYKNLLEDTRSIHKEIVEKTKKELEQVEKDNNQTKEKIKLLPPPENKAEIKANKPVPEEKQKRNSEKNNNIEKNTKEAKGLEDVGTIVNNFERFKYLIEENLADIYNSIDIMQNEVDKLEKMGKLEKANTLQGEIEILKSKVRKIQYYRTKTRDSNKGKIKPDGGKM